jgi:hypothetical protein
MPGRPSDYGMRSRRSPHPCCDLARCQMSTSPPRLGLCLRRSVRGGRDTEYITWACMHNSILVITMHSTAAGSYAVISNLPPRGKRGSKRGQSLETSVCSCYSAPRRPSIHQRHDIPSLISRVTSLASPRARFPDQGRAPHCAFVLQLSICPVSLPVCTNSSKNACVVLLCSGFPPFPACTIHPCESENSPL